MSRPAALKDLGTRGESLVRPSRLGGEDFGADSGVGGLPPPLPPLRAVAANLPTPLFIGREAVRI